jgi:hypothetical protein
MPSSPTRAKRACFVPRRGIKNSPPLFPAIHRSMEIWQVIKRPRSRDRKVAGDIQAKKINSRLTSVGHVGPHVQFGETRETWHSRQPASPDTAHPERNDTDPALCVECIQHQAFRNQWTEFCKGNRPMREQKIVPGLLHDPGATTRWPWTVSDMLQQRVQEISLLLSHEMAIADTQGRRVTCQHSHVSFNQRCDHAQAFQPKLSLR